MSEQHSAQTMHRLIRITLVNWYLFDAIDIPIEGNSILFRGTNGVGKSSILDAIQTILAGGDENKLSMNAASSDGKQTGRSIRSYVLGEVAESPGQKGCEPRAESNTYLCLSFVDRLGKHYSFGMSLHASRRDPRVKKNHFLLKGGSLSSLDFKVDEHTIIPWKTFEQRLISMQGKAIFPNTAEEFRDSCCELMSGHGAQNYISADMMFRAIKNALTFKEQHDISEFTRKFVLPENNINAIKIENDYREFKRIENIIADARERLDKLNEILKHLRLYKQKSTLALGYEWAHHEASLVSFDEKIEQKKERSDQLEDLLITLNKECNHLNEKTSYLLSVRDKANQLFLNSDGQRAIAECKHKLETITQHIADVIREFGFLRRELAKLEQAQLPSDINPSLKEDFFIARKALMDSTRFGSSDLIHQWPQSQNNIDETIEALNSYKALQKNISDEHDLAYKDFLEIDVRFNEMKSALEKMSLGKSSLMPATEAVIVFLQHHDITAIPVCDMASITDEYWQFGIESFLGSNRESLLILNKNGSDVADKTLFDRAVALYRQAKNTDATIRRVKIINPDKVRIEKSPYDKGTAAALIASENKVALCYLQSLLKNVLLVETEAELRQSDRALTPDGMISANGTISGGNHIGWVLIGKEARIRDSQKIALEAKKLEPMHTAQKRLLHGLKDFVTLISKSLEDTIERCADSKRKFDKAEELNKFKLELESQLTQLGNATDNSLRIAYETADAAYKENIKRIRDIEKGIQTNQRDLDDLKNELPTLVNSRSGAASERRVVELKAGFEQTVATNCFERLIEKLGDIHHDEICKEAKIRAGANAQQSVQHRDEGFRRVVAYANEHDIDDREEMVNMTPLDILIRCEDHANRIEKSELVIYEADAEHAQETMLKSFRSEVVAKLKESFQGITETFYTLNRTLKELNFNSNVYQFKYPLVEIETLKQVHAYVTDTSDLELDSPEGLFATSQDHPAIKIIQDILVEGRLQEISDYRNFYSYEIESFNKETQTKRCFTELLAVGSGGEKQAPFYVALAAGFMTAFKIRMVGSKPVGGAAIALFDEAFSKMDGNNSKAALKFFSDIGLQVILAAPPESEIKVGPYVEKVFSVIRSGDNIYLDSKIYKSSARELLESDNPHFNPHVVENRLADVKREFGVE